MLKSFTLENFKGVREPIQIEFRPLTLLFGPNSAGKSTILHGLHYANEIFQRRNFDPGRTLWGGDAVHLGGFETLVHGYDLTTPVKMSFELELAHVIPPHLEFLEDLVDMHTPTQARVDIEVRWSPEINRPVLVQLSIGYDGKKLAQIVASSNGRRVWLGNFDVKHPLFSSEDDGEKIAWQLGDALRGFGSTSVLAPSFFELPLVGLDSALPELDHVLEFSEDVLEDESLKSILNTLILLPLVALRRELERVTYIGPLRSTPPRNYTPARIVSANRWANGLAAWDVLSHGEDALINEVRSWMSDKDRLNTGYALERERFAKIPAWSRDVLVNLLRDLNQDPELALDALSKDPTRQESMRKILEASPARTSVILRDLRNNISVQPQDVGVGIAQLIPVVVAALHPETNILAVEQPEIHVHPALQVRLGDLFISQTKKGKQFLIETHSEQLLLRLLRRIRETFEDKLEDETLHFEPSDIGVYFITMGENGGTKITQLPVDETGDIRGQWPEGFFDERAEELF
jgi:hypothetical protein